MPNLRRLALLVVLSVGLLPGRVAAEPILQLDVLGGYYNALTQTIVSNGPSFTLVALLTPRSVSDYVSLLADTYFISAAVTPQIGPTDRPIGSYRFNGTTYNVTADMEYGTPPIEGAHNATTDPGDLPSHGLYPTFFNEFSFNFSLANRTETYNSANTPGGLDPTTDWTGVSYYQLFTVQTALAGTYQLHFDLYDTYMQNCGRQKNCRPDEDIDRFAPFSHDAQSGPAIATTTTRVPEPTTLMLFAAGIGIAATRRFKRA